MVVKEFLEDLPGKDKDDLLAAWKWIKRGMLGFVAAVGLYSSVYTVPADSAGVIKRFGEYTRQESPGLHFKLPYGIETLEKVPVLKVQKEEFGFRTIKSGVDSSYIGTEEIDDKRIRSDDLDLVRFIEQSGERKIDASISENAKEILRREYLMLTGDLGLADIEWIVQYTIKDAAAYLFNIKEPRYTIRDASQAIMRSLVGNGSIDEAITIGREEYEGHAKEGLQKLLDSFQSGIHIVQVKMQSCNPPKNVRPSFNGVNQAMQQKEQKINEAMKSYNEEVPRAKGEALGLVQKAEGYASKRVNEAKGDIAQFEKILVEYSKAPEITRQRMYLEAMSEFLPKIPEKWIIEGADKNTGALLKFLDLSSKSGGEDGKR